MPDEDCIYFGDTKNMPYGEKSKEQLIEFSDNIFRFFEKQKVKAVVMACNTTSATVYETLKNNYDFKIYPIIQSVTEIFANLPIKKLGVLATHATINSHAYKNGIEKINPDMEVIEHACPEWVKIVEGKLEDKPESIAVIKQDLEQLLSQNPEKIILGCTHYPYLLDILKNFAPEEMFINPAEAFAKYIKDNLAKLNLLSSDTSPAFEKFYVSGNPENFKAAASIFYDVKFTEQISLNQKWAHQFTGIEEKAVLFGVKICDYKWIPKTQRAIVVDPLYKQTHLFNVYSVDINGKEYEFAAGEFSNGVWGFYTIA